MLRRLKIRASAPKIQRYVVEIKYKSDNSMADDYFYFSHMNEVKKYITGRKSDPAMATGTMINIFKINYTHNYSLMAT